MLVVQCCVRSMLVVASVPRRESLSSSFVRLCLSVLVRRACVWHAFSCPDVSFVELCVLASRFMKMDVETFVRVVIVWEMCVFLSACLACVAAVVVATVCCRSCSGASARVVVVGVVVVVVADHFFFNTPTDLQ